MNDAIDICDQDVLLVVDIQNDFCPGGSLAVPRGDEIVSLVNRLGEQFNHVLLTQDWHPRDHLSFASAHPGKKPYDTVELSYGAQILWPDHCVQGTPGAEFRKDLHIPRAELVLRKGYHRTIDSYSAFFENDRKTNTGLAGYLRGARLSCGCSSRAWPSTSAFAIRRRMPGRSASTSSSSRMRAAASMSMAQSQRHANNWRCSEQAAS